MKILIAGDYCPQYRIARLMDSLDFSFFDELKDLIANHDFSIVNLECPITRVNDKPIIKQGPNLRTTPKVVDSLIYAGFNIVTTANNHILDFGEQALQNTLSQLDKAGILHVGTGKNLEEAGKYLVVEKAGETLAIINCCEKEFSLASANSAGANPIDIVEISRTIKDAKNKYDYVLVITHGGHEMFRLPPIAMKQRNRFFVEMGADAVVNHHQHVYSGYEFYLGKPIVYGLGNLCFDCNGKKSEEWANGYMCGIYFGEGVDMQIYPYKQCTTYAKVELLPTNAFNKKLEQLNSILLDDRLLSNELEKYYSISSNYIETRLQPYSNRWLLALRDKKIIPSILGGNTLTRLYNMTMCESHRAKLEYYMRHKHDKSIYN